MARFEVPGAIFEVFLLQKRKDTGFLMAQFSAIGSTRCLCIVLAFLAIAWDAGAGLLRGGKLQLEQPPLLVQTEAKSLAELREEAARIEAQGGKVTVMVPPGALVVTGAVPAGLAVARGETPTRQGASSLERAVLAGWSARSVPEGESPKLFDPVNPPRSEAFPSPWGGASSRATRGALDDQNFPSSHLVGTVAVGVIFPDSFGGTEPSTEDWTGLEIPTALNEIIDGLHWWASVEPRADLTFILEERRLLTPYEPINRPAGAGQGEHVWINGLMSQLGFGGGFNGVRAYVHDLRQRLGADWGTSIFLVDSSNDADNAFPGGRLYAFTYIGGPYIIATNGNGAWGRENLDATIAHELGHVFYALDEYAGACRCTDFGGRSYNVPNVNCVECPGDQVSCIMRGGTSPFASESICVHTRRMLGWEQMPTVAATVFPDILELGVTVSNLGLEREVALVAAVEIGGAFYFYPSWLQAPQLLQFTMPTPLEEASVALETLGFPIQGTWHVALLDPWGYPIAYDATPFAKL